MKKNVTLLLTATLALVLLVGIVWGAATLIRPQEAQAIATEVEESGDKNSVTAIGIGRIAVKPNVAYVTLGTQTKKMTASDASTENAEIMDAVLEAIKAEDIADEDVTTTQFTIMPQYTYKNDGEQVFDGYQVTNMLNIKIKNIDQVSVILDEAVSAGANLVENVSFDVDDRGKTYEDALELAVKDASQKVSVMMKAAGVTQALIPVRVVESSFNVYPDNPIYREGMGGAEDAATQLVPGTFEVTAQVEVTYTWTP